MMTKEEIMNVEFTKSFGGYKTAEVDIFIDDCAAAVESLTKEKAELTKKLEILADKLVEYRNDEDTLRTALLSAQRLGDTVLRESNHKATLILEDANIKAKKINETAERNIQEERMELQRIQNEVSTFKKQLISMYHEHLASIDLLPETKEPPAPPQEPAVAPVPVIAETPAAEETTPAAAPEQASIPFLVNIPALEDEDKEDISSQKFADLKFGDDYDLSQDEDMNRPFKRRK